VIIITGDEDTVVAEEIHSKGLARDIAGSELLWIKGLGHKPDYAATQLAVSVIEKIDGKPHDLQAEARALEAEVAKSRVTGCE
jgi:pimeloyl-ACP methyl ester carboxylesterase